MMRKKILLAQDPSLWLALEESFLRREGFTLLVANSGIHAMDIIEEQDPCLAILDSEMPGLSGPELCRRVKADPFLRSMPLALLLTSENVHQKGICLEAGCDAVILKPVNGPEVIRTACHLLRISDRAVPRIATHLPVFYGENKTDLHPGYILNLTEGGVFVEAKALPPVGADLVLELTFPENPDPVRLYGRVAWINHPERRNKPALPVGFGLTFHEVSPGILDAIVDFLESSRPVELFHLSPPDNHSEPEEGAPEVTDPLILRLQ